MKCNAKSQLTMIMDARQIVWLILMIFTGDVLGNQYDLVPGNWDKCINGTVPPTRVNTSTRVADLRALFNGEGIDAYIIPNEDAHQSEYPSEYDKRRGYISGFQGSAGFAVVTRTKAALWTDGRYFLEAEDTLDCNWILMRQGVQGVPGLTGWLSQELTNGRSVGASPFLIGSSSWNTYVEELGLFGITMREVDPDLIDRIWTNGRPEQPNTHLYVLPMEFSGRSWLDKITDMRTAMQADGANMMVVTSLDETAWLFNLRADDIAYNPFFISYAIVETSRIRLYLIDHLTKLTNTSTDDPSSNNVASHLNTNELTGSCDGTSGACVEVLAYNTSRVLEDVRDSAATAAKVLLSYSCNYAVYSQVSQAKIIQKNTPVATTKTNKNTVERQGMKNSHIRDAVALISFMAKLERECKTIVTALDGTTDVTRTFHFGQPSDYEKECYTRVLMGHIDLFQLQWPRGLYGRELEAFARAPLWKAGLVYRHGTGHGIGMFLSVHEGPGRISGIRSSYAMDNILDDGQFFSDEPGYYETDQFGIRLENIVMVTNSSLQNTFDNLQFLTFEHITFVPYEQNLIKYDMLNQEQIDYLNAYHKLCEERVGPELQTQGMTEGYNWMMARVRPISQMGPVSGVERMHLGFLMFLLPSLLCILVG